MNVLYLCTGATLYHLLTGRLPFQGSTALELILAKEKGTYPTARSIRPEVPERLDLIIDKMMAKDPNHRYRTCDEVLHDLVSLGIHGNALSFIDGAESVGPSRGGAATSSMLSGTQGLRRSVAAKPLPGASTLGSTTDAAMGATRIWYVQFEDERGKTVVEKHSTGRLLKMLASGKITAKARAKVSSDGTYYPLAQFPEFATAVEESLARKTVAIRKEDMQSLYKNVDKAQKMFHIRRKFKDMGRNAVSIVGLLIMIAAMGLLVYFGMQAGRSLPQKIMEMIGWGEDSGEKKPETPEGMVRQKIFRRRNTRGQ